MLRYDYAGAQCGVTCRWVLRALRLDTEAGQRYALPQQSFRASTPSGPIKCGDIMEAAALLAEAFRLAVEEHLHVQRHRGPRFNQFRGLEAAQRVPIVACGSLKGYHM